MVFKLKDSSIQEHFVQIAITLVFTTLCYLVAGTGGLAGTAGLVE